jgi:hypothetical protein
MHVYKYFDIKHYLSVLLNHAHGCIDLGLYYANKNKKNVTIVLLSSLQTRSWDPPWMHV